MSSSNTTTRRSFAKWLGISAFLAILPLIAIAISIAIYYTNLRPGGSTGMLASEVRAILYLHAFGVLLPCLLITIAITRTPPVPLTANEAKRKLLLRIAVCFLFAVFGLLLVFAALTCEKSGTLGFELGIVFYIASVAAPFAWLGFGVSLNNFRKTCELQRQTSLGLSSAMFLAVGVLLLIALAAPYALGPSSLVEMIAVPISGIVLMSAFSVLAIGLRSANLEHSGYTYG